MAYCTRQICPGNLIGIPNQKIIDALQGYKNWSVIKKTKNGGAKELHDALKNNTSQVDKMKVCGIILMSVYSKLFWTYPVFLNPLKSSMLFQIPVAL